MSYAKAHPFGHKAIKHNMSKEDRALSHNNIPLSHKQTVTEEVSYKVLRRMQKAALQEVGIEVTDEGEPMERYKNRMTCKHCGMEDICLLRSHHGPNGGITMSCNMFVKCRRNQNWDKEHQFQIATVEGEV